MSHPFDSCEFLVNQSQFFGALCQNPVHANIELMCLIFEQFESVELSLNSTEVEAIQSTLETKLNNCDI